MKTIITNNYTREEVAEVLGEITFSKNIDGNMSSNIEFIDYFDGGNFRDCICIWAEIGLFYINNINDIFIHPEEGGSILIFDNKDWNINNNGAFDRLKTSIIDFINTGGKYEITT